MCAIVLIAFGLMCPVLASEPMARAQTPDFPRHFEPDPKAIAKAIKHWNEVLRTPVDLHDFPSRMTLKTTLLQLIDQLLERDIELPILVDTEAFRKNNPDLDIYVTPVKFSRLGRRATITEFLREAIRQIPVPQATCYVDLRLSFLEITIKGSEAREFFKGSGPRLLWELPAYPWQRIGDARTTTRTDRPKVGNHKPQVDLYGDPLPPGAIARFGTVRWRVGDACQLLAYAPDGKTLVSVDGSNGAVVWETATGKRLRQIGPFPGHLRCAAVSRDGRLIALAGEHPTYGDDTLFSVWELSTGKERGRWLEKRKDSIGGVVGALAFSPEGTKLASRYFGSTLIKLWDLKTGKFVGQHGKLFTPEIWEGSIRPAAQTLAFAAEGKYLISAGEYQDACTWDLDTGRAVPFRKQLKKDSHWVLSPIQVVGLSPDGQKLAWVHKHDHSFFGNWVKTELLVGDINWKGKALASWDYFVGASLAFSADSRLLAAAVDDGEIAVWDVVENKKVMTWTNNYWNRMAALALSPDGKTLAVSSELMIRFWDIKSGKEITPSAGHRGTIWRQALSPDGKTLVTHGLDNTLRIWDGASGRERCQIAFPLGDSANSDIVFSPDSRTFACTDAQGRACLFDVATSKVQGTFVPYLRQAALRAGFIGSFAAGRLSGRAETAVDIAALLEQSDYVWRLVGFTPDGAHLVGYHGSGYLSRWDVRTGRELQPLAFGKWELLANSHQGKRIMTLTGKPHKDRKIHIRDVVRDKELCVIQPPTEVTFGQAFFPNGQSLAYTTWLGYTSKKKKRTPLIRLVEVHTGRVRRQFVGNNEFVGQVVVSPDGRLLASTSETWVGFWDVALGKEIGQFTPHAIGVRDLYFSNDGKQLITVGTDSIALLWDVAALTQRPRESTPKALSPVELDRLWNDLAQEDASRAFDVILALETDPERTLPFLKERVCPAPAPDAKQLAKLIADLGSDLFAVRQAASKGLESLGERAESFLKEGRGRPMPLEQHRRIELVLQKIARQPLSAAEIRALRAVEVLEGIGNAEALRILESLAGGAADARLTDEAAFAAARVNGRLLFSAQR